MSFAFSRRKWTNLFRSSTRKQRRAAATKPSLQVMNLEDRVTPALLFSNTPVNDLLGTATINSASTSENITASTDGEIHVAYSGSAGVRVATSINRGMTFQASTLLSANNAQGVAVKALGANTLYVTWVENDGMAYVSASTDSGLSFSPPQLVASGFSGGPSLAAEGTNVYVQNQNGGNVWRNTTGGIGVYTSAAVPTLAFRKVGAEPGTANVYSVGDNPTVFVGKSTDAGASFAADVIAAGAPSIFFSSSAYSFGSGGAYSFVAGDGTLGAKIDLNTNLATSINYGNNTVSQGRSIAADKFGNVVDGYSTGGQIFYSVSKDLATSFAAPVSVVNASSSNVGINPAFQDVVVVYENGGNLFLNVYEDELATGGTINASLLGGVLTLDDTSGANNALTAVVSGTDLVITDANEAFTGAPAGGTLSNGNKTLTIPLASVSNLVINGSGGSDTLRTIGSIPVAIEFNGGTGTSDALRVSGTGLNATYTPSQTTFGSGTVAITGGQTITFTGLEPVDMDFVGGTVTVNTGAGTADLLTVENSVHTFDGTTPALKISGTANATPIEAAYVSGAAVFILTNDGTDSVTVTSADNAHGNTSLNINAGTDTGDAITINGTTTVSGTTTLNAPTINLNANVTNAVTGATATTVNVASPGQIQDGINVAASGAAVNVSAGSYAGGILIDRTLTISGTGSPTVTSNDLNGQDVGFQYAADNGILQGFNIVGDGVGTEYGVLLSDKNTSPGYSGGTVQNNSFNNLEFGIATADGAFDYTNAIIQNNMITIGTGTWGIYLQSGSGHQIYGNNISGGAGTAGVFVRFSDNVTIGGTGAGQGNTFIGTFGSLLVADANNISFIGNTTTGTLGDRGAVRVEGNVNGLTINQNSITGGVNPAIRIRQNFSLTPNSNITANNNFLTGNQYAIQVDADGLGTTLDARFNDMSGSTTGSILNADADSTVNASGSYFGTDVLATVSAGISGLVDYTPYLNLGTDTSAAAGFQGDFSDLTVHAAGAQSGMTGRITEGYNALDDSQMAGGILRVIAGTYTDNIDLTAMGDKKVTLAPGSSPGQVTINGNLLLSANDTLAIEIGGLNAATDYDNLIVIGTVSLGGATLDVQQFAGFSLSTMVAQSFTIIDNDDVDLVTGEFAGLPEGSKISYAGGNLYITYQGGDGNDVVLNNYPVINGTAAGDTVTITPTATGYDYQLNMDPVVSVVGTLPFVFNGLGGDDTMTVNLNAFNIPTIVYDGGTQDSPATAGANAVFGDVLVVNDQNGTHTATYTGDGTLPMSGGFAGTVAVMGENTITFTGLEPVDMIGLAVVNIAFANGDDAVTIAQGVDAGTGTLAALVVSGTSGLVGFEQVHLRNNTQVNIDTTDVDGDDTVTITGAANAHGNANLSITTGAGTDSVSVTGAASFNGSVAIETVDYTSAAAGSLLAGTDIDIDITGNLLANGSIQVSTGSIDLDADGSATFNATVLTINPGSGSVSVDAGTTLTVGATGQLAGFTSVTTNTGGDTTFNGQVISAGPISITSGGTLSTTAKIFSDYGLGGTISTSSVGDTTFGGNVQVIGTGSISISTSADGDLTINSPVLTNGGDVTATVAGSTFVNAVVSASGSVSIASDQDFTSVAAGTIGAGTTVVIEADVTADADVVGATVSIGGAITAGTTTTITTGGDADSVTISAAINGTSASVSTADAADSIVVNTSGTAPLSLDGEAAGDSYTVNVGTLNAAVSVADSGATGTTDTLNVNGTAAANTFEVNTATGGDATVAVDTTQVVTYTNAIETLNLDGGDLDDTFNIFFAQGGTSFLPALVNIVDTGATGTDVANVSGTDAADSIDVNFTADRTTTLGGETITYANGNLETLNVFSKAGNDVVFAKAVSLVGGGPVVNLDGGTPSNPTPLPGDILILDVTGMMGLDTANITTPDGSVTSSSHNDLTWVDFETIPTPIGLGGTFDFGTAASPVQAGPYVVPAPGKYWVGVANTDTYASKGYYGWATAVNGYDRGANSPSPLKTTFQNLLRDGNWFGPLNVARTFSVAAVAAGDYQVSVTIGDTAVVMDSIFVTIEGNLTPIAVQKVLQNQFVTVTGIGSDDNSDGKIDITFVDKGGTHSYWHVNALDVRPVGLVSPVTITRADMMATALVADGLSKTTYFADGFFPNSIVTVSTTGGAITSADVDPFLVGVQVLADANGKATFELQHPTGNANVTLTASAAVVVDAKGSFTQPFTLTPSQKIDFNSAVSPTEPGYLGVSNGLYADPASNGLGWAGPVSLGDRGAAAGSALFRDFVFNLQGAANAGTFVIDLPTDDDHVVTVYLGDTATARDRMQIEVFDGTAFAVVATEIRSVKTNSVTFTVTPYANMGAFQTRLRFSDLGGTQNGWSVQGLEYRTLASQQTLSVTPTADVMGNGTAVTNYTITGGAVGGLVTLTSQFGKVLGTDASALYDGFQVLLDGSGEGSFSIQSPVVAAGSLASAVGLVAVNGSHAGGFTQQYLGAQVKYDFGTATSPVSGGYQYLSGSTLATTVNGVGFKAAAGEYDRNPTSYPNVSKTTDPALFRDAAWGSGSGTFRVLVQAGATDVPVRVYSYDAFSGRGPITVTAEGGAKQTLTPSLTTPAVYDLLGSDSNNDGFLDITVAGGAVWMMNGIEVG